MAARRKQSARRKAAPSPAAPEPEQDASREPVPDADDEPPVPVHARDGQTVPDADDEPVPSEHDDTAYERASATEDGLSLYRAKRSVDHTPEPFGGRPRHVPQGDVPRLFVVQMHAARRLHWDLRLETGGVLRSWAVPRGPSLDPAVKRLAVETEDHPIEYTDYEGVIPDGNYGAGEMIVWDRGTYRPLEPFASGYRDGKLLFELRGHKLRGTWTLVRTKEGDGRHWLLIKKPDGAARPGHDAELDPRSVLSGLTVEELAARGPRIDALRRKIEAQDPPRRPVDVAAVQVMLAEPVREVWSDPAWLFELKYDGYRLLVAREHDTVRLRYRSGRDATATYPEIVRSLQALPFERFVLDAEVVVLDDDARPNFARLAERSPLVRRHDVELGMREHPATLYAFDLLAFEDWDLRELPLVTRKTLLQAMLPATGILRYADHVREHGEALMREVQARGVEGIVAKRADARYVGGRSDAWKKIRIEHTTDLVIVGFEPAVGNRLGFRGLFLGAYAGDRLCYVGRVGTGFSDRQLVELREQLDALVTDEPLVESVPAEPRSITQVWVRPELVVEVRYSMITRDRLLREPRFERVRPDKAPRECTLPLAGDPYGVTAEVPVPAPAPEARSDPEPEPPPSHERVVITNPNKVFWPAEGYTKRDLVEFYRGVSPWILPYLRDRPLTLTRYPDGIEGKSFFQKHAPPSVPKWVRTHVLWVEDERREIEHFVCDDVDALAYVANMAAIPLHVRAARLSDAQHPDWCVIDLDPKVAPFVHVVRVARFIRTLCVDIGLPCYCKTSGSTGLHVMIPLARRFTFAQCKLFAEVLARVTALSLPEIATIERFVPKRKGRVYVDYGQNGQGRLIASMLCVRARPGATVSTPLLWDEVTPALDPGVFTIKTVIPRLEAMGDPMAPLLSDTPDLPAVLAELLRRLDALGEGPAS